MRIRLLEIGTGSILRSNHASLGRAITKQSGPVVKRKGRPLGCPPISTECFAVSNSVIVDDIVFDDAATSTECLLQNDYAIAMAMQAHGHGVLEQ